MTGWRCSDAVVRVPIGVDAAARGPDALAQRRCWTVGFDRRHHHSQTQMHPGSLGPDGLGDRPMKVDGMNADSFQVIAGDQVKEDGTLNDDDAHDLTDYRTDGFQGNVVKELAPTPVLDNGIDDEKFVDTPPNEQNDVEKVNAKLSPCC